MNRNGRVFKVAEIPNLGFIKIPVVNDKAIPIYVLKSPVAKKYSAFRLISKDLDSAFSCLNELKRLPIENYDVIEQSLSFYAVVTYAKCFTEAKGRGSKLDVKNALKYCNKELILIHKFVMDLRHKYVAHSETGDFENNPVTVAWQVVGEDLHYRIDDNLTYKSSIRSMIDEFTDLLIAVDRYVSEVIDKTLIKLHQEVASIPPEDLNANSFIPDIDKANSISATGIPLD